MSTFQFKTMGYEDIKPMTLNLAELQAALESAPKEDELQRSMPAPTAARFRADSEYSHPDVFNGRSVRDMATRVAEIKDELYSYANDPIIMKMIVMSIANDMIEWHTRGGVDNFPQSTISGVCWLRDAGHYQVVWNIVQNVGVGEYDFMVDSQDDVDHDDNCPGCPDCE